MVNVALIGAGRMGWDHARHLTHCAGVKLVCVVDRDVELAEEIACFWEARAYESTEEALEKESIDAVMIVSPTDTHADLICLCAEAGKAIFCEKPIDLSLEATDHCLEVVERTGVSLFVGFNRRFDPSVEALYIQLQKGKIGSIEQVSICSKDQALPSRSFLEKSGGIFRDMMIHDFDMARWLLGEEPVEIFATGSCLVDPSLKEIGDLDTAAVILRTESGKLCQISTGRRSVFGYDQRIEVAGEKGILKMENLTPTSVVCCSEEGETRDCIHPSFPQRYEQAYINELKHFFYEVVMANEAPLISGQDARQALVIANAAWESVELGRAVAIPYPAASLVKC